MTITYIPQLDDVDEESATVEMTVTLDYMPWETLPKTHSYFLQVLRAEFPEIEKRVSLEDSMSGDWVKKNIGKYIKDVQLVSKENTTPPPEDTEYDDWERPVGTYIVTMTKSKWLKNQKERNYFNSYGLECTTGFDVCPPNISGEDDDSEDNASDPDEKTEKNETDSDDESDSKHTKTKKKSKKTPDEKQKKNKRKNESDDSNDSDEKPKKRAKRNK
jgi:hypothetical protein